MRENEVSIMIDISKFSNQQQTAGVCVLLSYWRILEYFNPGYLFYTFCKDYLRLILAEYKAKGREFPLSVLDPLKSGTLTIDSVEYIKDTYLLETITTSVFHYYCKNIEADIRGYAHIKWLHDRLLDTNPWQIQIPPYNVQFTEKDDVDQTDVLSKIGAVYEFVMTLFKSPNGWHSVLHVKSGDVMYVFDPNLPEVHSWDDYDNVKLNLKFEKNRSWKNYVTECLTFSLKSTANSVSKYDYLIVGSGLFGATFAYRAKQAGKRCLVIDKRPHLGGNVYCENIEGINVHKYGAHIFHTNNKVVWDFVNSLVPFNRYTNCPVANYHGELYDLPFNMNTFAQLWGVRTPDEAKARIAAQIGDSRLEIGDREPRNLEEQALLLVGRDIYEKLIKEYTEKQWGRDCKDLPAFIIKRLPVRFVFDNNYFNDAYQGIPEGGYNVLIQKLLEGVETKTNCDFFAEYRDNWREIADQLIYTGPIDEFYNYQLGHLDWRTVSFQTRIKDTPNYQGNAVINYTSHDVPYTRVIEHKHFEMFGQAVYDCPKTVVSEEYSTEYKSGMEQFYPVNDERNNKIAEQYRALAEHEKDVIFGGRLAEYKYYDMAPVIEKVLNMKIEE